MKATVRQAVVRTHGPAPALLLRELVRFGVTDILLVGGTPPLPALPREARVTCRTPADAPPVPEQRCLVCEAGAVLDFNLALLLREAAPCVAVRDGADTGIRLHSDGSDRAGNPVAVTRLPARSPRPALFLDRDGTINVDHGYVGAWDRFEWRAGALDAIRLATDAGWHVFVVTNQSGVARGFFDEAAVDTLHDRMVDEIRLAGGNLDDIRSCPFHEQAAVARYRRASDWRKPAPGMILDLMTRWSLDPARCAMVGDQPSDLAAAAAAGIAGYPVRNGPLTDSVRPLIQSQVV